MDGVGFAFHFQNLKKPFQKKEKDEIKCRMKIARLENSIRGFFEADSLPPKYLKIFIQMLS